MKLVVALLAMVASALSTSPAFAQDVPIRITLPAKGQWVADFGEGYCALIREFEGDGIKATLRLERRAPGPYFQATVASPNLQLSGKKVKVAWLPDATEQTPDFNYPGKQGGLSAWVFTDSLQANVEGNPRPNVGWRSAERKMREEAITGLSVSDGFDRDVELAIGEMHQPMNVMRNCVVDLYASWGVDVNLEATLKRRPEPINGDQITKRIFATLSQDGSLGEHALPAILRLVVSAEGDVTACRPDETGWTASTLENICGLLKRKAHYKPALNEDGTPVPYYVTLPIETSMN